jgi:TonB-linked SusC/RagA family outer membrane protein
MKQKFLLSITRSKCLFLLLLAIGYGTTAFSQNLTVKGTVTGADDGLGIPGVSIRVKNTATGTITDNKGAYSIAAPVGATLIFSYLGYESQEKQVGSNTTLNISLKSESNTLNDVVVIGYGTQRRASITASTSSVTAKQIENQVTTNILDAVAGQMPGVEVTATTGRPGGSPMVKIRGTGSISAENAPLYVVDGLPLHSADDINMINPNDIATFDVLKDASAAAIYGSRGGNGVVLITTKKGKAGQSKIDFSYYRGIEDVPKRIDVVDRDQSIQYYKDRTLENWLSVGGDPNVPNGQRLYAGSPANINYVQAFDNPESVPNTDWQDLIYRKAAAQSNYQLAASGGTDKLTYFISGNYFDQEGIIKSTDFKRYTARVNVESKINAFSRIGMNLSPSYSIENRRNTDLHINSPEADAAIILPALVQPATLSPYTSTGLYNSIAGNPEYIALGYAAANTPLQPLNDPKYHWTEEASRWMGTLYGEVDIFKAFTFRSTVGIDARTNWRDKYRPSTVSVAGAGYGPALTIVQPNPFIGNIYGQRIEEHRMNWTWDNTLTYQKTFAKNHDVNVLAGYSAQKYTSIGNNIVGVAGSFQNDLIESVAGSSQIITPAGGATKSQWTLLSYFARLNYSYKDKYLLQAVVRRDGSSKFGSDTKWGVFPSVSLGWRVTEEDFAKQFTFLNELKLRASYGETGNFNIDYYRGVPTLSPANYTFGNSGLTPGYAPSNLPNDVITWEVNKKMDVGVDVGILKNRLSLTFDYYRNLTTDLLYNLPIPAVSGYTSLFGNLGKIENKGIDISLTTANITNKDFKWTTSLNFGRNRNKVLQLGKRDETIVTNSEGAASTQQLMVGYPVSVFFNYKTDGVFRDQADVDAHPEQRFTMGTGEKSGPGDTKFVDVNGDGVITIADKTIIGNPNPDFLYGISNHFNYKGFDLDIQLQGVQGNDVFYLASRFHGTMAAQLSWSPLTEMAQNYWKSPEEPGNGVYPRAATLGRPAVGYTESQPDRWLRDGSYLRIRNVTLGYNLPATVSKRIGMNSVRLYTTVQNLYTFTNYIGYNPDVNVYGNTNNTNNELRQMGVDYSAYPLARTFTFGVNIGL